MKPRTSITQSLKVIVLAGILAFGLQYVSAQTTWSPPTGSPPNNNTSAPINVGGTGQIKSGGLTLGSGLGFSDPNSIGLNVAGGGVTFKLTSSGPSAGQVLKAADSTGKLVWGTDATGGGGGGISCSGCSNGVIPYFNSSTGSLANSAIGGDASRTTIYGSLSIPGGTFSAPGNPPVGSVLTTTGPFGQADWRSPAPSGGGGSTGGPTSINVANLFTTNGWQNTTGKKVLVNVMITREGSVNFTLDWDPGTTGWNPIARNWGWSGNSFMWGTVILPNNGRIRIAGLTSVPARDFAYAQTIE